MKTRLTTPQGGAAWAVIALIIAAGAACRPTAPPASTTEITALKAAALPVDAGDPAWQKAPLFNATLLLQDMVEPRQMKATTAALSVRAVTDGKRVAFLLEWPDATDDDLTTIDAFSDACAVQMPEISTPDAPAPQMGDEDLPVQITYWRASWQAQVGGRPDEIGAHYPQASIDHYPFQAASLKDGSTAQAALEAAYAPARALGNPMEGPRTSAVQDLLAAGPGTLTTAPQQISRGQGQRTPAGWAVVINRPLPEKITPPGRTIAAFAVWDGAGKESGSRKMRTAWAPLLLGPAK